MFPAMGHGTELKKSLRNIMAFTNLKQHLLNAEQLIAHLRQPCVEI